MLLHQALKRGLLRPVALVMNRGAIRRPLGLPADGLHAKLPKWGAGTGSSCALRLDRLYAAYRCVPSAAWSPSIDGSWCRSRTLAQPGAASFRRSAKDTMRACSNWGGDKPAIYIELNSPGRRPPARRGLRLQRVEVVGPLLHHAPAVQHELGSIVCSAERARFSMGELDFDNVRVHV